MGPSENCGWHPSSLTIFKLTNNVGFKNSENSIIVQCLKMMYNICFLRSVAEMAGGFLARSQSLPDVMTGAQHREEGGEDASSTLQPNNTQSMATILSYSEEEGLALLGQRSPTCYSYDTGQPGVTDAFLLDYDSDSSLQGPSILSRTSHSDSFQLHATDPPQLAAMDTDVGTNVIADVMPVMDSVYYQCRSASLSAHKDTLISVSNDESYSKNIVVQSPSISSFEDSSNIDITFHGSRVMKGNTAARSPSVPLLIGVN
jgi:hypothetical protein